MLRSEIKRVPAKALYLHSILRNLLLFAFMMMRRRLASGDLQRYMWDSTMNFHNELQVLQRRTHSILLARNGKTGVHHKPHAGPRGALDVQPWTLIVQRRFYSDQAGGNSAKEEPKSNLQKVEEKKTALVASRIVETTKDVGYGSFALLGFAAIIYIAYSLFHGLFSSASPQAIYSSTCDIIKNDSEVERVLGSGVVCFGNERKGSTVSTGEFVGKDEKKYLVVTFYVEGPNNGAVVTATAGESTGRLHTLSMIVTSTGEKLVYTKEKRFIRQYR